MVMAQALLPQRLVWLALMRRWCSRLGPVEMGGALCGVLSPYFGRIVAPAGLRDSHRQRLCKVEVCGG